MTSKTLIRRQRQDIIAFAAASSAATTTAASMTGDSSRGPQLVLRLFQWKRRWGSIPQWAGLRACRRRRFERCAFRSNSLELDPCPCIALVLTARVPSTAAGLFLVVSIEYGGHLGRSRCACAQTRAVWCGTCPAALALRVDLSRSADFASHTGPFVGRLGLRVTGPETASCDMYGSW